LPARDDFLLQHIEDSAIMSTTGVNFVYQTGPGSNVVQGSNVVSLPAIFPVQAESGKALAYLPANATIIDKVSFDFSRILSVTPGGGTQVGNFAKNGCVVLTLTGTTPITVNLTALAAATGVIVANADGTAASPFATVFAAVFTNLGTADVTIAPGSSNPAPFPTSQLCKAGGVVAISSPAGYTISGSANTITVTPTAGGLIGIAIGGA
jgi:hypothetical protein